jgi:hypothetical protein
LSTGQLANRPTNRFSPLDSLLPFALLDTVLFIVAGLLVVQRGAFWHPLTMYLLFHGYTVTWRVW